MKIDYFKLVVSLLICLAAGFIGSMFTTPNIATWFDGIIKPVFSPPNWVFAPVWTTLYLLMGYAFYMIWDSKKIEKVIAMGFFIVQLGLNAGWSIIFFGAHNISLAFAELVMLDVVLLITIIKFHKINKTATYLLIPYFLWCCFATILNYSIMILN